MARDKQKEYFDMRFHKASKSRKDEAELLIAAADKTLKRLWQVCPTGEDSEKVVELQAKLAMFKAQVWQKWEKW